MDYRNEARYTKMKNYLKTIGKSALVAGIVTASYFVGLNQNPTFSELPQKAQQAIVETHQDLDTLLTEAVGQYKRGNPQKALELYRLVEQEAESLEKIDPSHEDTEARMFQYGAAIIDTGNIVTKHIDSVYKHVVSGTPERIAEYVTAPGLSWLDDYLEVIGLESGAYHRLSGDKIAQESLLNYYVDCSLRWYDAQEQMLETLKSSPTKTEQIEWAIKILDDRMEQIKEDREFTLKFKQEINH